MWDRWSALCFRRVKSLLLAAAWLAAVAGLYLPIAALEFYWNIPDWQPRFDAYAMIFAWLALTCSLLASLLAVLTGRNKPWRAFSLVPCAVLLALGIYLWPAEPLSPGLLGRDLSSPLWYRGARAALLGLPALSWLINWFNQSAANQAP